MMRLKSGFLILCVCGLFTSTYCAFAAASKASTPQDKDREESCGEAPHHTRVGVRYTTLKGIGYSNGYATLEGFFASPTLGSAWLPFLDVRGHVFDNGKFAANAGLGLRYLASSRIWGGNAYYDYRNTTHQHYNQVSAGLESLGRIWDFRLNGYLPVGSKESAFRQGQFGEFSGHYLFINCVRDFALKGANAEAGFHLDHFKKAPLYFAAGPYYLTGKGATTWGAQMRAAVDVFSPYVRLEANTAYDHFFKWTGQGQITINIPFGGKKRVMKSKDSTCGEAMSLATRSMQPVDRHEIIPVGKQNLVLPAIDPLTDEPYYFVFVNNLSSSLGTYESPYPNLADAQSGSTAGDIIYVFPGDGSAYDTVSIGTTGLVLQASQKLFGSSTAQSLLTTVGTITIPALTTGLPIITNSGGSAVNVITLADHNTISGFSIEVDLSGSTAISGSGISNFLSDNNEITGNSGYGLFLTDLSGLVEINNSTFSSNSYGVYSNSSISSLSVLNSTFSGNTEGIYLDSSSSVGSVTISNSILKDNTASGFYLLGSITDSMTVSNSFLDDNETDGIFLGTGSSISTLTITGSEFSSNGTDGIEFADGSTVTTATLTGNTITDHFDNGIEFDGGCAVTSLSLSGNTISGAGNSGVALDTNATVATLTITGNTFSDNGNGFYGELTNSTLCTIENNTFSLNTDTGIQIPDTCNLEVSGNTFTCPGGGSAGYAATIQLASNVSVCVDFYNNTATPTSGAGDAAAYLFSNGGSGTFKLTAESTQDNNTGLIQKTDISPDACTSP